MVLLFIYLYFCLFTFILMFLGHLTSSSMPYYILILYFAVSVTHPRLASIGNVTRADLPPSSKPVKIWTTRPKVWCMLHTLQKTMSRLLYCFSSISTSTLRPFYLHTFWEKLFGMLSKALLKFKICHSSHFLFTWQIPSFHRDDTIYTWQSHRVYFYLLIMLHRVIN